MDSAPSISKEGGDDVKSLWPLWAGLYMCYNGGYKGLQQRELERIQEKPSVSGMFAATREHEAGIASNRKSSTLR